MEVEHDGDGAAAELEERGVGPLASRARFPPRVESERGDFDGGAAPSKSPSAAPSKSPRAVGAIAGATHA